MNQGIKNYSRLIETTVGNVTGCVNISSVSNNVNLIISLQNSNWNISCASSLIFSLLNINDENIFGKGIRLSWYKKINEPNQNNVICVENSDFSSSEFVADENNSNRYNHDETDSYIVVESNSSIKLFDKYGNFQKYNGFGSEYPELIYNKKLNRNIYNKYVCGTTSWGYLSSSGEKVEFKYNNDNNRINEVNLYRKVSTTNDYQLVGKNTIEYEGDLLSSIKWVSPINSTAFKTTIFEFSNTEIIIECMDTNHSCIYNYDINENGIYVTKIIEVMGIDIINSIALEYNNTYTTITQTNGKKLYYHFDSNNLPTYILEENGYAKYYSYNEKKQLIYESNIEINDFNIDQGNLVVDGYFNHTYKNWISNSNNLTIMALTDTDNYLSNILGVHSLRIEKNYIEDPNDTYIYQEINEYGTENDRFVLNIWGKIDTVNPNGTLNILSRVEVAFIRDNATIDQHFLDFTNSNTIVNKWEFKSYGFTPNSEYDKIIIKIHLNQINTKYDFDGICLIKKDFGTKLEYDKTNVVLRNTNGKITKYKYDINNDLEWVEDNDGDKTYYKYDEFHQIISQENPYSNITSYLYDGEGNCIYTKSLQKETNIYTEERKEYSPNIIPDNLKGQFLTKEISKNDSQIIYEWNQLEKIISKIIDANGAVTNYTYDGPWKLIKNIQVSKENNSSMISYSYNQNDELSEVVTPVNGIYKFNLDNKKRLESILFGTDTTTFRKFTYHNYIGNENLNVLTNLISKIEFGNKDSFILEYDEKQRLKKIYYNTTNNLKYSFQYDKFSRITKVIFNVDPEQYYEYKYNQNGQISLITDSRGTVISYDYNGEGNVSNVSYKDLNSNNVLDEKLYVCYNYIYESKGLSPEECYRRVEHLTESETVDVEKVYSTFMNKTNPLNLSYQYGNLNNPIDCESPISPCFGGLLNVFNNGIAHYVDLGSESDYLGYRLPISNNEVVDDIVSWKLSGSFWFNPSVNTYVTDTLYLFSTGDSSGFDNLVTITYVPNYGALQLVQYDHSSVRKNLIVSINQVFKDRWNHVIFSLENKMINGANKLIAKMAVNGRYYETTVNAISTSLSSNELINIGCARDGAVLAKPVTGKYSSIALSSEKVYSKDEMIQIYNEQLEYIFRSGNNENAYFATTVTPKVDEIKNNSSSDIIFFNNSLTSYKGKNPIEISERKTIGWRKEKKFKYNDSLNRYAYVLDGNDLVYNYNLTNSGSIKLKCYLYGYQDERCLFEAKDDNGKTFGLFVLSTGTIRLEYYNGSLKKTKDCLYSAKFNEWNTITLKWNIYPTWNYITITVNGAREGYELYISAPSTNKLSIGKRLIKRVYEEEEFDDPLYGYIADFILNNDTIENVSNCYTKKYDKLGLLKEKEYTIDETSLLKQEYEYNITNNKLIPFVKKEIHPNYYYDYSYDNRGNITEIKRSGQNYRKYEYDYRGFLTKETHGNQYDYVYQYDKNGNILSKTKKIKNTEQILSTKTFSYENINNKDLLTKINGSPISYSDGCINNITSDGNLTYQWEGDKLIECNKDENEYRYKYDSDGLRIFKSSPDYNKDFFYEGNMLVREKTNYLEDSSIEEIYYLYDENSQLYGFDYISEDNLRERYYYLRDILGNIIGIFDETSTIVVNYEYDAWGKIISTSGTKSDTIGAKNPFRYKGYYYDVETQLFYCNSRYYSPEFCRFISPDSIEYLDPESINGLNLYCYCMNNPIMYADPSGHFTIAALLISVGLSLAFEFVGDLIDGNGIDHSLREYIGAGVSGLFGGLGGGLGAQIVFSVAGGIADSWISGELNGDNMGQVLFSIGVSTVLSSVAGHLGGKLASKLKGNSLAKLGRHEIKNSMKNMGLKFSLNKNGTSAKAITKFLNKDTSVWLGKIVGEYGMAGTVSGLYSLLPF